MKIKFCVKNMVGLKSYSEAYAYVRERERMHQIARGEKNKSCNLDNWVDGVFGATEKF